MNCTSYKQIKTENIAKSSFWTLWWETHLVTEGAVGHPGCEGARRGLRRIFTGNSHWGNSDLRNPAVYSAVQYSADMCPMVPGPQQCLQQPCQTLQPSNSEWIHQLRTGKKRIRFLWSINVSSDNSFCCWVDMTHWHSAGVQSVHISDLTSQVIDPATFHNGHIYAETRDTPPGDIGHVADN